MGSLDRRSPAGRYSKPMPRLPNRAPRRRERTLPSTEDIWDLVKSLPPSERDRLRRWLQAENRYDSEADSRLEALAEFLAGRTFRWEKTDRDEWHAR